MIRKLSYCIESSFDPYHNLAVERFLPERAAEDECILYLWQNQKTVVIGYNQNVWKECRTAELAEAGGIAVRRMSGGGAVFHDLGNLNFTFCMAEENYDQPLQQRVLLEACRLLGIDAELSGRNDLTANGCKFSGNSFWHRHGRAFHNGTLLIDADMEHLGQYLSPSKAKLRAKAVDSVRSRVINLKELRPDLTIDMMKDAMLAAFEAVYSREYAEKSAYPEENESGIVLKASETAFSEADLAQIEAYRAIFADPEWTFTAPRPFDVSFGDKFAWGEITIELSVEGGQIREARVWTDSLDTDFARPLADALTGCRLSVASLSEALDGCGLDAGIANDLKELIRVQVF